MQRACEMVVSLLRTDSMTQKCPFHVLNVQILELLQKEGLIRGFSIKGTKIDILLKHYKGAPVIRNIRVVSKPSRDIWLTPHELKFRTRFNTGLWVMQTSCGVISHRDCIRMGIGGKMLFAVNNGYQHFC
ncbi:putative mitochondrial ribosomal protein S8 precursor [Plasmodium gaboni]|uniref:Mitochondrial ribosomal protein S8, putative n=2 Tax=Plasmodium (Laverania) TaxID=418107 RepID=A0A151LQ67_9APIC|nr:putative mitochondrial ribosomal protein S8 precursor [Plasmodium gaboni]XP_028537599.1 mitochondrial ribosomal protein S8 precursor, putative [Plasmodium sp. gorilla clade G2]CDO63641.1 mitochondrial ribosomal protein S8 precursor, putative [Plasmodium reichenowi]SOV21969.1 mitochondrial ribosomal protein S8 precursor, putative [Plasmodium sp. DRC-Itaito]SOV75134.1 mitochondrial ribosomal protein S8 precursor, putative [Plasmodium sp. gorilla clade G3]KYO01322.1 putative mitochondrial ribo